MFFAFCKCEPNLPFKVGPESRPCCEFFFYYFQQDISWGWGHLESQRPPAENGPISPDFKVVVLVYGHRAAAVPESPLGVPGDKRPLAKACSWVVNELQSAGANTQGLDCHYFLPLRLHPQTHLNVSLSVILRQLPHVAVRRDSREETGSGNPATSRYGDGKTIESSSSPEHPTFFGCKWLGVGVGGPTWI